MSYDPPKPGPPPTFEQGMRETIYKAVVFFVIGIVTALSLFAIRYVANKFPVPPPQVIACPCGSAVLYPTPPR